MGESPGALGGALRKTAAIPNLPSEVPVGLPSELLRHRPDVRRAERELAAATARIGVAVADLFPRFFLTGAVGLKAFPPVISSPAAASSGRQAPPSSGRSSPPAASAKTSEYKRQELTLLAYQQAVLTSLEEVENALAAYGLARVRLRELTTAEQANRRAVELAHDLSQRAGGFSRLLDAERSLYATQAQLTQSEKAVSQNLVRLYKALGGGWKLESTEDYAAR